MSITVMVCSLNLMYFAMLSRATEAYESAVLTAGPVAFYELNEMGNAAAGGLVAVDATGNVNGTYLTNVWNGNTNYNIDGPRSMDGFPGFITNNAAAFFRGLTQTNSYVTLPGWNVNTNAVTITAWIKPATLQARFTGLVFWRGINGGANASASGLHYYNNSTVTGTLGYNWNNNASTYGWDSGLKPPTNQWSFVALMITPTNATIYLMNTNGMSSNTINVANTNAVFDSSGVAAIGNDYWPANGSGMNRQFAGTIDAVAIFNRSLSQSQLLDFYDAATNGGVNAFAPLIIQQPVSVSAYVGTTVQIGVIANATPSPSYQWQIGTNGTYVNLHDGGNISGSTTPTLTISNVAASNATNYIVVITNSTGSVTSSIATLTMVTFGGDYTAVVITNNPIAYYRLNELGDPSVGGLVAFDSAAGFNGIYGTAVQNGNLLFNIPGPRPANGFPGFSATNTAAKFSNGMANAQVTVPAWNLNTNTVTITAWLNPSGSQALHAGVVFCRAGSTIAGFYYSATTIGNDYTLGYNWNNDANTYNWNSGLVPPTNQWSYVALVVTPTNAIIYLIYSNTIFSATNVNTQANAAFDGNTLIGNDSFNTIRAFNGIIDEVSVFNHSLSHNDLVNLYAVGSGMLPTTLVAPPVLAIQRAGSNLQVVWRSGTLLEATNLMGPWLINRAASPYTMTPTNAQMFYRVQFPLQPHIVGDWWQIAGVPDLGTNLNNPGQQPVDFAIWQAADGTWQIQSCIRGTKEPGNTRLFYRWQGNNLTDTNWTPMGIAMEANTNCGETLGGLQAPYVFRDNNGRFVMFYGSWEYICSADSPANDGKTFTRILNGQGKTALFTEGIGDNTRDPMVMQISNVWYCYFTAYPQGIGSVYCRTSLDLTNWSASIVVNAGGQAGSGALSAECPTIAESQPGVYYLFRNQLYGQNAQNSVYVSANPLDFGVNNDVGHFVCRLPIAAPEIFQYNGEWFIAALLPNLNGVQISHLIWQ